MDFLEAFRQLRRRHMLEAFKQDRDKFVHPMAPSIYILEGTDEERTDKSRTAATGGLNAVGVVDAFLVWVEQYEDLL